ncbi:MAG: 5'-3'-deoxyribonucleotidase [Acidobacteriaceae bacterium]|nr:5'-3'-deoxyribonucleotidase [Acidobacteriaceae bacterium]
MESMKKSEIPQRICIDMDEVMADSVSEHLARYNREYSDNITKADLHGKWIWDVVSIDRHPRLEEYLRSDDFFDVLGVMDDAPRVLRRLQQHYEVFIASAAMEVPTSFNGKYRWLEKHFPTMPSTHIVFCGDKGILRADYLIDDNPRQLRRFVGEGILYEAPHNVAVTGYRRVKNWLDVETLFLADK